MRKFYNSENYFILIPKIRRIAIIIIKSGWMNFHGKLRTFKIQSTKNESSNRNVKYDSFNFIDNVTNKKIAVKDVVTSYGTRKNTQRKKTQIVFSPPSDEREQNQWEEEIEQLKDCLSMMKGTKLFQLDSLRNKIFKHLSQQKVSKDLLGDTDEVIEKKKEIRLLIESSVNQLNRRELRTYLSGNQKRINPKIITLNKNLPSSIKKHNIEKVLQEILQNIQQDYSKKNKKRKIDISDIKLPDESTFEAHMMDYLRKKIQSNGQYLIYPGKQKQLYHRLHKSKPNLQSKSQNNFDREFLNKLKFSQLKPNQRVQSLKKKLSESGAKRNFSKQLAFQLIQHKLFFDFQVLTFTNPEVLYSIDTKGNTLLHIAAKNGETEVFEFILKKKCHQLLKIKNNFGKRPYDLAKFFGSKDILETILSLQNGKMQGYY